MAKTDMSQNLSSIIEVLKDYLNIKLDLAKLEILHRLSKAGIFLFTFYSLIISVFAIVLFLLFAFSFWYGEKTGNLSQGFLISAGIIFLFMILLFLLRRVLFGRILIKNISEILFSDSDD